MDAAPLIVIFGAAVRPDGQPSAALKRRIECGAMAARVMPQAQILCSGGARGPGPTEASIMVVQLLASGVAPERLIRDDESLTTLENIHAAVRQVRQAGHPGVISCSDAYHLPRIRLGFALYGVASRRGPAPTGSGHAPWSHWIAMCLREIIAIPVYLVILIVNRNRIRP